MDKKKLEYFLVLNNEDFRKKLTAAGIDVSKLDKTVKKTEKSVKDSFKSMAASVGKFTVAFNQGIELITKAYEGISKLSKAFLDLDKNVTLVEKRFNISRGEAEKLNNTIGALSKTFETDVKDSIKASTVLIREFGIDGKKAVELLEKAALKVPTQFNELLEQSKEYASQLSQIGIDADHFLSISTQALQQGVWSDKGVDAIKEFNLSLRELTPDADAALAKIGISGKKIQDEIKAGNLTVFEALTQVSNKLDTFGINSKEVGQVLADVFKGAGEDAGKFILEIGKLETSLDEVEDQISDSQKAQLELNKTFSQLSASISAFVNFPVSPRVRVPAFFKSAVFLATNASASLSLSCSFSKSLPIFKDLFT